MNDADRYSLTIGALRFIRDVCERADADEDADPWLALEEIFARADDTLANVTP